MRVKVSVPHMLIGATWAHAAHMLGIGDLHAQAMVPSQFAEATFGLSGHGEVCISVTLPASRLVAWKRDERASGRLHCTGGRAGYIADCPPFTVAGSERA